MERNVIFQCLAFCVLTTFSCWLYAFPQVVDFQNTLGLSFDALINFYIVATVVWQINHGNVGKYKRKSKCVP